MTTTMQAPPSLTAFNWRSRGKAALIHLGGSATVAALAAALVFTLWYPWPYRIVSGGAELFALLVSVDVVLGPLVTFTIFDRRKRFSVLRRDLVVVVMLQLAALGYGLHTTFIARPVVLALEGDRFRAVAALAVVESELPLAPPSLQALSVSGPRTIRTIVPAGGSDRFEAIQLGLAGIDLGMRPRFWQPWDDAGRREALANAKPLDKLLERLPSLSLAVDAALARTGYQVRGLAYLPLLARRTDWVVLLDARSGDVVGFAPVDGY